MWFETLLAAPNCIQQGLQIIASNLQITGDFLKFLEVYCG
jgi:hypothetical protein